MEDGRERDLKGLSYIQAYQRATGRAPSLRAIGAAVGYDSPRSVQMMLKRLHERGLLGYVDGEITLTSDMSSAAVNTIQVPLVGSVACGLPSLAEQDPEGWVRVSTRIATAGQSFYLLRARGTSMNAARIPINPGELVLVRQQAHAEVGDLVVALIDNEATIKEFSRQGAHIVLRPRSTDKEHGPILVTEDLVIQGVVVAVLPDVFNETNEDND